MVVELHAGGEPYSLLYLETEVDLVFTLLVFLKGFNRQDVFFGGRFPSGLPCAKR